MKQVTGSNTPQATNKVSIQLTLDGHSFSAHGLDGEFPGEEPVEAELLTARTMLVPEEVLGTGDAGTLLAANGMAPAAEERAVCSLPVQGIVAVMAVHREALRQAEEKLGDRIRYTTPLLREVQAGTPTVWAYRTAGLLYIKVYDGILRFAGVIPAPDTADVCYFTERLKGVRAQKLRTQDFRRRRQGVRQVAERLFQTDRMRIVSGKYKGRAINPPRNLRARPTTDFAKENLFNVLGNLVDFEQCDVLDLFAGTGSISYEFASRGARSVTSVEINPVHYNFIRQTAAQLGIGNLYPVKANAFLYLKELHQAVRRDFFGRPLRPGGQRTGGETGAGGQPAAPGGDFHLRTLEKMDFRPARSSGN